MPAYVDTSALVKRYVAEVGSAWVRRLLAHPAQYVIWTCSHDTGHIWEEILPHPSESISWTLKDLEQQSFAVFWGMILLIH